MSSPVNVPIPSIQQATQNAARLLQQAMASAVQIAAPGTVSAVDLELARSNVAALSFVQGVGLHGLYRYARDFIARQAVPGQSSGAFLDGWLDSFGLARKEPSAATGSATGTGVNGTVLPQGALIEFGQIVYKTTADATVAGGVLAVNLIAVNVGSASNVIAGAAGNLVSPVAGIDSGFTTAAGLGGGTDQETDQQAVYRLIQRLSNEPMGGSPGDYARWALSVPGITRAWGVRNPAGPTSAGVIIMADENPPYGLPTSGQQGDVYDYITDPRRGPPDELFVIIPTAQVIDLSIRLTPDTAAGRAAAEDALADLFFRESVPGGEIPHTHVSEVLSSISGEYNHEITSPAMTIGGAFTATSYSHLLVLGTVTFEVPL